MFNLNPPFWAQKDVIEEPILFFKQNDWLQGNLILLPDSEIRVKIWCKEGYKEIFSIDKDNAKKNNNCIILKVQSDLIPFLTEQDIYRDLNAPNSYPYTRDMKKGLLHSEEGLFHKKQTLVNYAAFQTWNGYIPKKNHFICNRVESNIKKSKHFDIFCFGDSISAGCNCSKQLILPPFNPSYSELIQNYLNEKFISAKINLKNDSVGGQNSKWGTNQLKKRLQEKDLDFNFDLNFIAWGANDSGGKRSPKDFIKNIKNQIILLLDYNPNAIILLISSSLTNSLWHASHNDYLFKYRDLMKNLMDRYANQVGLVDMSQLWHDLLMYKNYYDLTGNGLNHPNDFGHKLYAQSILSVLGLI